MESRLRRPSHVVPSWVKDGAVFHIRIRVERGWDGTLVNEVLARRILDSVAFYQEKLIWNCRLMVLMPDHLHALVSFSPEKEMSQVIGAWKHFHVTHNGTRWQQGYFDHRIRADERLGETATYIRANPVASGLCAAPEEWEWVWDEGVWI